MNSFGPPHSRLISAEDSRGFLTRRAGRLQIQEAVTGTPWKLEERC